MLRGAVPAAVAMLALTSFARAQKQQKWKWTKTNSWPTGNFEGKLCLKKLDEAIRPDCGWKLNIDIRPSTKQLNVYWPMVLDHDATIVKKWKTIYTVTSADYAPAIDEFNQGNGKGCYKIQFQLDNNKTKIKRIKAALVEVCQGGTKVEVTPPPKVTKPPATPGPSTTPQPVVEPTDADYILKPPMEEWHSGTKQDVCLFHTKPVVCGWEAEFVFKGAADISSMNFEVWKGNVVEELVRSPTEVRLLVRNTDWYKQPDGGPEVNPVCIDVLYRYPENKKPTLAARFTQVCIDEENDKWSKNPNKGGTVPPTAQPTTQGPTTPAPTTQKPTTPKPTTQKPTTQKPTTQKPTTQGPTTQKPTTQKPTTQKPTTQGSTTQAPTTQAPTTQAPTTSGPTANPPTITPGTYEDALNKSMQFYFAQRSGALPDNRVPWRGDSALTDTGDQGEDLTGGWYDAGDHVKFNFPMSWSTTTLLWGLLDFKDGYTESGTLSDMYEVAKWPLDYLLKCWDAQSEELYGQVGDGHVDHSYWGPAETMTMNRPAFKLSSSRPGSNLAGETAAALAAGSLAWADEDPAYSQELLKNAKEIFDFADKYRGKYSDSISNAQSFYNSWSGYNDELCWAAAWLHRANRDNAKAGDRDYLALAKQFAGSGESQPQEFSWDNKWAGCYMLLYQLGDSSMESKVKSFLAPWTSFSNHVKKTPCGLAWLRQWGPLRYSANTALVALQAAKAGIETTKNADWAQSQLDYMLGAPDGSSCPQRSYVIGFNPPYPLQPHHRGASCIRSGSSYTCEQGDGKASPHILTGALVGGPDTNDFWEDKRSDYIKNEVATDYNAGFQGALAGLVAMEKQFSKPSP